MLTRAIPASGEPAHRSVANAIHHGGCRGRIQGGELWTVDNRGGDVASHQLEAGGSVGLRHLLWRWRGLLTAWEEGRNEKGHSSSGLFFGFGCGGRI